MTRQTAGRASVRKGKTADDADKQQRAFELSIQGYSLREVAHIMTTEGTRISHEKVRQLISAEAMARVAPLATEYRSLLMARLDASRLEVLELLAKTPAPVTAGKDGFVVRDPDTGEVVRDYAVKFSAIDRLVKIDAELAKLVGAYAPARTEATVSATVTEAPADVLALIEQAQQRNAEKRAEISTEG